MANKNKIGDIDLDVKNREEVLPLIDHTVASIIREDTIEKHNTGIYVQKIPTDPITSLASLDYERAEELGYVKLDILNNNAYADIKSEEELERLICKEPDWILLEYREIVENFYHIHDHFDIIAKLKPQSVEQLAMALAIIRPGKRHLLNKSWPEIEREVWIKTPGEKYSFKRAHATSYAMLIVMQMNQFTELA